MSEPMDRCPYAKKGQHHLACILPETSDLPVVLYCEICGSTKHVSIHQLPAADDVIAAVERIVAGS
jgi:hypothetical protein